MLHAILLFFLLTPPDTSYINLDLYPLEIGNYWEFTYENEIPYYLYVTSREVKKDTLLPNGEWYKEIIWRDLVSEAPLKTEKNTRVLIP